MARRTRLSLSITSCYMFLINCNVFFFILHKEFSAEHVRYIGSMCFNSELVTRWQWFIVTGERNNKKTTTKKKCGFFFEMNASNAKNELKVSLNLELRIGKLKWIYWEKCEEEEKKIPFWVIAFVWRSWNVSCDRDENTQTQIGACSFLITFERSGQDQEVFRLKFAFKMISNDSNAY